VSVADVSVKLYWSVIRTCRTQGTELTTEIPRSQ